MAPKHNEKGFLSAAYEQITAPDNATIVRSILVFGVRHIFPDYLVIIRFSTMLTFLSLQAGVAFLHSSLSELLLPP
ncbi:hypothetical protein BDV12DRAFT_167503 [Aspergillus spectabilis]